MTIFGGITSTRTYENNTINLLKKSNAGSLRKKAVNSGPNAICKNLHILEKIDCCCLVPFLRVQAVTFTRLPQHFLRNVKYYIRIKCFTNELHPSYRHENRRMLERFLPEYSSRKGRILQLVRPPALLRSKEIANRSGNPLVKKIERLLGLFQTKPSPLLLRKCFLLRYTKSRLRKKENECVIRLGNGYGDIRARYHTEMII